MKVGAAVCATVLALAAALILSPRPAMAASSAWTPRTASLRAAAERSRARDRSAAEAIARAAIKSYHLRALIVRVTSRGRNVYTAAFGLSMTGVRATPAMHFRNGAFAFTYMATMMLELVDRGRVSLDDRLSRFMPSLPHAGSITIRELLNMTSGYADYVYQPALGAGLNADPFRQWTSNRMIQLGVSRPLQFAPGTNFAYSHTNYVILGRVLAKITGLPLLQGLRRYVLRPMGLDHTQGSLTPAIPSPVLHSFSSERRQALHIPARIPFYEESTYWNPSWTTAPGAVETTTIGNLTRTMDAVASGKLLSPASHRAQVTPSLVGFGHKAAGCPACVTNTAARNYGLGVANMGSWVTQTKNFAGSGATAGVDASRKLAVAVVTTYAPAAFNAQGNYDNASSAIFSSLASALARGSLATR